MNYRTVLDGFTVDSLFLFKANNEIFRKIRSLDRKSDPV